MKKLIAVALVLVLALSLVACSSETNNTQGNKDVKIGVILVHDENTGYDEAHINGIKKALETCGIPNDTDQLYGNTTYPRTRSATMRLPSLLKPAAPTFSPTATAIRPICSRPLPKIRT